MAKTSAIITVGGDTRQLERDIQSALSRDFKFKGLNEKAFTQPLGRITGAANEFQKSLDASNARVIAFGASAGLIYTIEKAFTDLIGTTVNVQKSLTDINVILNTTSEGLAKFGAEIFNIAKNTGQSFQQVAAAATEFARQGLGVEETLKRTRDALILTRLSGLDVLSAVEALTATVNSFNKVALDSTTVINKLANVDAAFAVSSADLANAIQRVGSSAQDAGVGFDELLGIVTSVQQTTARGGAVIGNSLKTIFTRIQRTEVLDQLEALGVNVRSLEGETLPAIQILRQLATTFDKLNDSQRAQVAESVGGVFQINVLKAALGDLGKEYSIYERALKTSTTSTDEAIKRNAALNETISALFNRTTANVGQLASTIGAGAFQPAIENTLKNINKVLEAIGNQDTESVGGKIGQGILKGLSTFISGPGIVLLTTVIGKLSLDLAKFATSGVKTLLGVNQQVEARAQIQAKINQVLSQEPQLLTAINAKQVSVLSVENQILKILQEQNTLRTQAANLSTRITSGLVSRGVSVQGGQITTKSAGFIPNYALSEIYGALAGGYQPGSIKRINIPGEGPAVYNSAEKVKTFPGMSQPAIMPPKNSKAGKKYQKDFMDQNGFDPYLSDGFVPNFAANPFQQAQKLFTEAKNSKLDIEDLIKQRKYQINPEVRKEIDYIKANPKLTQTMGQKEIIPVNASQLGIVGVTGRRGPITAETAFSTLGYTNDPRFVRFEGIQARTLEDLKNSSINNKGAFSTEINRLFLDPLSNLANTIFGPISPDPKFTSTLTSATRRRGINLFPPGTEGSIFEAAVNLGTKKGGALEQAFNQDASQKPFDFEESSPPSTAFNTKFQFNPPVLKADAKRTIDRTQAREIIDKAYRDAVVKSTLKLPEPMLANSLKSKSSGFIPNFTAFKDAVQRELNAGVPMSKIRLGQDNRLVNKTNPLGYGIYNTEDEPNGLKQGIAAQKNLNEARKAGSYATGFIPNFAAPFLELSKIDASGQIFNDEEFLQYQKTFIVDAKKEFNGIVDQLRNQQISLKEANKQVATLGSKYNLSNTSVTNMNASLQAISASTKSFNQKVSTLERSAGGFLGLGLGGGRQLRELERLQNTSTGVRAERASAALDRARQSRQAGLGRLQGVGLAASFGVPIVAQTIAGQFPENKKAQAVAEGLGTAASFAGIGAIFGPIGIAVGGVVGSLVGFKKALDIVNSRTEEFAKQAKKSEAEFSRLSEDVQTFLYKRAQAEGLRTGEVAGTKADLTRIEKQQANALAKIFNTAGPEITDEIKNAITEGNEEALKEALGRASAIKQSTKEIDGFVSSIVALKEQGKLKDTFDENIIAFGNLKTTSGETFAELISKNDKLISSLSEYSNTISTLDKITDLASPRMKKLSEALTGVSQFNQPDWLDFSSGAGSAVRSVMRQDQQGAFPIEQMPDLPFTPEDIAKKIKEIEGYDFRIRIPAVEKLFGGDGKRFKDRPEAEKFAVAVETLAFEQSTKALEAFGSELSGFVDDLVGSKQITEKNGKDIKNSLESILKGEGDPREKIKLIIQEFRRFGEAGQMAADTIRNLSDGIFSFSKLSGMLSELFTKGDGTEGGDIVALEKRRAAGEMLQRANFTELFKDPELFKDFQPNKIIKKLLTDTSLKIAGGTVEEDVRMKAFGDFADEFKNELKALAEGGKLTSEQFARLSVGAERAATSASLQEENLTTLNKSISDTVLAGEAVQEYLKIEEKLRAKFGKNLDLLSDAAKAAAQELIIIQKSRLGQAFVEETAAGLTQTATQKIRNKTFTGLDVRSMTNLGEQDYQKIILDSTTQAIQAVNANGAFDDQTRTKLINQIILEQEKSFAKLQGGGGKLSIREISDLQTNFQKISERSSMLKNGLDQLNSSIGDNLLKEEAKSVFEEKLRELEVKYGDNLVALKEATDNLINSLEKEAQFREGRIFAEDLKAAQEADRIDKIKNKEWSPGDVFGAFSTEMLYGAQDAMRDLNALGTDTARTLKSEFNNAFQSVVDGTSTVGDAFRNMALNISRRIQQLAMEMSTNLLFNSLFSGIGGIPSMFKSPLSRSKGGIIKGYSSGGRVIGGSGMKDDVPAMLSKGEYVIRKSSVQKYGEDYLRELNSGGAVKPLSASQKDNLRNSEKENLRLNNLDPLKKELSVASEENLKFNEGFMLKTKSPLYKVRQGTSSNIKSKNSGKFLKMASGGGVGGRYANYMPSQEEIDKMFASANWQGTGPDEKGGRKVDDTVAAQLREGLVNAIANPTTFDESSMIEGFYTDFGGGAKFNLANFYSYDDPRYPTFGKTVVDPLLSYEALNDENNPMNQLRNQRRADLINYLTQGVELGEQNRQTVIDTIRSNMEEKDRIDELNRQQQDAFKQQQRNALFGALMSFGIGLAGAGLSSIMPQFNASPAQQFSKTNTGLPGGRLTVGQAPQNLPKPTVGGRLSVPSVIGTASYPNLPSPQARLSVPAPNIAQNIAPTYPSARLQVPQYINQTPYSSPTASYQRYVGYQGGYSSPFYQKNTITPYRGAIYRKTGGPIGFAKGGSPKDDIPALLMGGEYVIKKDAVDFYGKNFFDDLNKGRIKKFADGGMVGNTSPQTSLQGDTKKENKQIGDIANEINITVNINGSSSNSTESSKGSSSQNQENTLESQKLEAERAKALSGKIKTEVIKVITEQQRPGGLLSSEFYKKQA